MSDLSYELTFGQLGDVPMSKTLKRISNLRIVDRYAVV